MLVDFIKLVHISDVDMCNDLPKALLAQVCILLLFAHFIAEGYDGQDVHAT